MWFDAGVLLATARRAALVPLVVAVVVTVLVPVLGALVAAPAASAATDGGRFAGTVRLPGCSGSVVRWPAALDSDRAVVLTNGHCVRRPFLGAREVLVGDKRWTRVELLDGLGRVARVGRAVRLQYATMYRTDVAVLRLRDTYADLARLRREHPALRRGGLRWAHVDADTIAYLREHPAQTVLVVARRAAGSAFTLPGTAGRHLFGSEPGGADLSTAPDGVEVAATSGPRLDIWELGTR
ncbi:hypothetical protein Pve01_80000 [Planomonospora venezuelensis]|nr:hypothetical protein Pve01_80000 [Planomonospora venezuelensis]